MRDRTTLDCFLSTTFVVPDSPAGPLARQDGQGPVIDVFTCPDRMPRDPVRAPARAVTGRRLLAEVPVAHRYVIDPGWPEECEVRVGADRVSFAPRLTRPV